MVEVDSEEVKRHLEILGYTDIEPNLLNEFIKDLKKVIEYDRKHNNISVLSMSLYQEWNQTYSERMKNSTPIRNTNDRNNGTANEDECEDEVNQTKKHKNQNCFSQTSSKIVDMYNKTPVDKSSKYESEFTQPKCYFCGCMENQSRLKMKRSSNPLHTLHLSVTFGIEL